MILSIVFNILEFVGAIYVLISSGTANAGAAVIPMVISLSCLVGHRICTNKKKYDNLTKEYDYTKKFITLVMELICVLGLVGCSEKKPAVWD